MSRDCSLQQRVYSNNTANFTLSISNSKAERNQTFAPTSPLKARSESSSSCFHLRSISSLLRSHLTQKSLQHALLALFLFFNNWTIHCQLILHLFHQLSHINAEPDGIAHSLFDQILLDSPIMLRKIWSDGLIDISLGNAIGKRINDSLIDAIRILHAASHSNGRILCVFPINVEYDLDLLWPPQHANWREMAV